MKTIENRKLDMEKGNEKFQNKVERKDKIY